MLMSTSHDMATSVRRPPRDEAVLPCALLSTASKAVRAFRSNRSPRKMSRTGHECEGTCCIRAK